MEILQHEDHKVEEFRDIARNNYAGSPDGPAEGEVFLHNIDRVATLEALFHNPYYRMVVDGLSDVEMIRLCAIHLMERLDFRAAGRLLSDLARLRARSVRAPVAAPVAAEPAAEPADAPEAAPEPARPPRPVYRLDPDAAPVRLPPLTENERRLRALSDDELVRQCRVANARSLQQRKPG